MSFKPAASLTEQIASHLAEEIISGKLAPEERIRELKVATHLGVSRGSVREALLILEGRHLIEIVPRRGAVVSALSRKHVDGLLEMTSTLLTMLTGKTAQHWSEPQQLGGFDDALNDMAGALVESDVGAFAAATSRYFRAGFPVADNCYLQSIVEDLLPAHQRLTYQALSPDSVRMEQDLAELRCVLSAIRTRAVGEVESAMDDYCQRQRERSLELDVH